jgi:hypothetical protein
MVGFGKPLGPNGQPLNSKSLLPSIAALLAQTSGTTAIPARSQVSLNGRVWKTTWAQWSTVKNDQGRRVIGVSDVGLAQILGLRLLGGDDPTQQSIEWFSDSRAQPQALKVGFDGQIRYLDIAPLAEKYGWQVDLQPNFLSIKTPTTNIETLRIGNTTSGDRWVFALNRPTPWQLSRRKTNMILTVEAQPTPDVLKTLQEQSKAKGLKLKAESGRVTLEVAAPLAQQPRVWILPKPDRLILDWQSDRQSPLDLLWTPGVRWQQETITLGAAQFPITRLVVNPQQEGLKIQPILPNPQGLVGTNPLVKTAQVQQVAAAINGGFFNRIQQMPLGAIRIQGRWISSPILNRGAIGWNDKGGVVMGRLQVQEQLTTATGQALTLQSFNSGYVKPGIARYSPDWGGTYTPMTNDETVITVQANQIKTQTTVATAGGASITIPRDGYLLVLRANKDAAAMLAVGTTVSLSTATTPNAFDPYPSVIGAGPLLISQGQIVLDAKLEQFSDAFIREQAPRSAIARQSNGHLAFVTVQNRSGGTGPTLAEWAQLLQQMGFVDALNLDGGSSTSLYLGGDLINRAREDVARVHNGIGVWIKPSTEPLSLTEPLVGSLRASQ